MSTKKQEPNMPAATPTELAAMIDYQEGSVVSRTLQQDEVGTLTVFSFDQGQGLSEHTSPFNAYVQILDGQAEITIGGKSVIVQTGQLILMPGGIPHQLDAVQRFKMLLTLFRTSQPAKQI
ncbi:cupin [Syntrophotalea acetylenivorans]|uniref:Cupin n=1 Tax=Syntrophotalea acetylenivorans TaxID=1842532 RepID=A0A1L3GND9_9BACT|nr:cupin domain-containing protein [Syntrophotalea acetylenivorans]APG27447.1 cupin [Syntrophotalea acetylenivorans]